MPAEMISCIKVFCAYDCLLENEFPYVDAVVIYCHVWLSWFEFWFTFCLVLVIIDPIGNNDL